MKSKIVVSLLVMAVASFALTAGSPKEKAWFDMENCGICVSLISQDGLMEHMTWENYITATGMVSLATVDPEYTKAYEKAHAGMEEAVAKMHAGEAVDLCNFCKSYGALMMSGAKIENFATASGDISVVSSTDPEVIAQIQKHARRTIKEFEKMNAEAGD